MSRQSNFDDFKRLIDQILKPQQYGFEESYRYDVRSGDYSIIYNSERCRVYCYEASADRWAQRSDLRIRYGRLHAPNPKTLDETAGQIVWNVEECRAWWNDIDKTVLFLDGISPQKAAIERLEPDFLKPYWEKVIRTNGNIEEVLQMHRAVWERYGTRLFEVFDLRRSDLWERFKEYIEEYYKAKDWKQPPPEQYPFPPPWKIC